MAESSFTVTGLREAIAGTMAISKRAEILTPVFIQKSAQVMVDVAKGIVVVKTGRLRDSIEVQGRGKGFVIKVGAPYAGYVENGTSKMEARPFMQPAVDLVLGEMEGMAKEMGFV